MILGRDKRNAPAADSYDCGRLEPLSDCVLLTRTRTDRRRRYRHFYHSLCAAAVSLLLGRIGRWSGRERSLVPRSRSHARLRRNATMSYAFSYVQSAFIDL
ncbi:hypothetical protein EVAR_22000_1 [Eumeta japonica]|uniref:Uncharacterized protein n=1 Tax=Eumeta variegata TaxID=151549 RepID=A0A4C1Z0D9_EUMVA|nr:hypothetical protein EVAR_22000_1 [Eumeta japonica]